MTDLLGCPFCGRAPYYTETVNGTSMAKVGCAHCGIEMKCAWVCTGHPGAFGWSKDIRAAWNTREDSAKPWAEVSEQNKRLMIAVAVSRRGKR